MQIALHKNARTTPATRAEIAASKDSVSVLAKRYGVTEVTIRRRPHAARVWADASHTPHRLQTTLSVAQEHIAVELRRTLLLSWDDLLAVMREFVNERVSRSGLSRCLTRYGVGNLNQPKEQPAKARHKPFKACVPGYLHIDIKYLPKMGDEPQRRYLFVAIDRATRWVFVRILPNKTAASARNFLQPLHAACPIKITHILTDNGKEFTDRLFASREREPTRRHEFDRLCHKLGIQHRFTHPRTPQTNGMVERFNGRIADVLKTNRFIDEQDLRQTLLRYVFLYNHQLPQSVFKSKTPFEAMQKWYSDQPQCFVDEPQIPINNQAGCDK